jgi:hypothetical protein
LQNANQKAKKEKTCAAVVIFIKVLYYAGISQHSIGGEKKMKENKPVFHLRERDVAQW